MWTGYNVTILAYGQTGSGKTHTMGTAFDGALCDDIGVIPRAVTDIFTQIESMPDHTFNVSCAFIELYQEKLYDLLSQNPRDQSVVDIREESGRIIIPNLTEITVKDEKETTDCLIKGSADRAVGATAMNATSSRSHAIFTITVQKVKNDDTSSATIAKFHLVDLAGSERSKKTLATGEQFKEGVKINQGLLALGNVISALGASSGAPQHISYRDSKLTRLLQDSLGGNSMTLMIACISPADYNMEETLGTLRYADRARKIKNKPIVNEDPKTAEINKLKMEIQNLRLELLSKSGVGGAMVDKCKECTTPPTKAELHHQITIMAGKLQITLCDIVNRENIINEYEDTVDSLNKKIVELKTQIADLDKMVTSEMSPDDMDAYKKNVTMLAEKIASLNDHVTERKESIMENSRMAEAVMSHNSKNNSFADHEEELAKTNKEYIEKQVNNQDELKEIKAQIAMKEELHKKLFSNFNQYCSLEIEHKTDPNMQDLELELQKKEDELEKLKEELRGKKTIVSAKLAEERRKRVQQLEAEIAEVKMKNKQQALMLKQREKDGEKITRLNADIQEMKQMKVKLIRKMKTESEEFRQWRLTREKELVQLRAKDRKMQTEVARKDALHEKQRNVLKRKVEEANSANKRLKEALAKQQKTKTTKNDKLGSNVSVWLNEEMEVISSIVDLKQSFEQLVEVRADLNERLRKVKRENPKDEQIKSLKEEIEMRSAQIADMNTKISEHNLDIKIKAIHENVQNLPESRSIIKYLVNNAVELRTNSNSYFTQMRDSKHALELCEESKEQVETELRAKIDELTQHQISTEKEHEEKTAVLLRALSTKGSYSDDEKKAITLMEEELSRKNEEIEYLRGQVNQPTRRRPRYREPSPIDASFLMDDDDDEDEEEDTDDDDDPEWRKTPMHKRNSGLKRTSELARTTLMVGENIRFLNQFDSTPIYMYFSISICTEIDGQRHIERSNQCR